MRRFGAHRREHGPGKLGQVIDFSEAFRICVFCYPFKFSIIRSIAPPATRITNAQDLYHRHRRLDSAERYHQ